MPVFASAGVLAGLALVLFVILNKRFHLR
jgi:hypothetical protein